MKTRRQLRQRNIRSIVAGCPPSPLEGEGQILRRPRRIKVRGCRPLRVVHPLQRCPLTLPSSLRSKAVPLPQGERGNWVLAFALLLVVAAGPHTSQADTPATSSVTGVVTGRVIYQPDKARPWRYQRYYVKHKQSGELAEAVVALRGRRLKAVASVVELEPQTIDQFNFRFVPETTAIRAGQSITFTNSDATTHNVRSVASIATFNINLETEDEYTHHFKRAGGLRSPVTLGCVYHGGMRAWVYVIDHPFFSVTQPDGRFEFKGVPPGKYTLEMVHPAGQLRWKDSIVITPEEPVEVEIRVSPDQKTLKY